MEEDGGQTEVMCSYDLDLLCNTYLYLISILGDGIWAMSICAFVHLTSGGPTAQILSFGVICVMICVVI